MSPIHQIYCTHCTHGSSALERREGELSRRMLGYSARAGSLEAQSLRDAYRRIERYISYYLPRDTPTEEKLQRTATTAPRRLFFIPSTGGLQIVGQVAYRPTDTEGRPGSYFAHVLFRDEKDGQKVWTPIDCLKLWSAPGWVEEDTPGIPFLLPSFGSLDEMLAGRRASIDDRVFLGFLQTPIGGAFDDPSGTIPDRWRQTDPQQRIATFLQLFRGLLEIAANRRESLVVVLEPAVAALMFHGIVRLLPSGTFRDRISFSTYEPNPDRLGATLAATVFYTPQETDLRADAYRSRDFAFNTFRNRSSELRRPKAAYAETMVRRLLDEGWPAVDWRLKRFSTAALNRAEDLDALAEVDRFVSQWFDTGIPPKDRSWERSAHAAAYLREAIEQRLAGPTNLSERLAPIVGRSGCLLLLDILTPEPTTPETDAAIDYLLRTLPDEQIANAIEIPGLLLKMFARSDMETIERFFRNAGEQHSCTFSTTILDAARQNILSQPALSQIGRMANLQSLLAFFKRHGPALFDQWPADHPAYETMLRNAIDSIPEAPSEFDLRLNFLSAGVDRLPEENDRRTVEHWNDCRAAILEIGRLQQQTSGLLGRLPIKRLEAASQRMARAICGALPPERFEDESGGVRKQTCLRQIATGLLDGATLLPDGTWQYEALWQKIIWYFDTGQWRHTSLEKLRPRTKSRLPVVWIVSGVAAGFVLLLALIVARQTKIPGRAGVDPVSQTRPSSSPREQHVPTPSTPTPTPTPQPSVEEELAVARSEAEAEVNMSPFQPVPVENNIESPPAEVEEEAFAIESPPAEKGEEAFAPQDVIAPSPEDQIEAWNQEAEAFAAAHGGRFFREVSMTDGLFRVPDEALQMASEPSHLVLGPGRLERDSKVYSFGGTFDSVATRRSHAIPDLAAALDMQSVEVKLRVQPTETVVMLDGSAATVPRGLSVERRSKTDPLERESQSLLAQIRKYKSRSATSKDRNEAYDRLVALLAVEFPNVPDRPDPRSDKFKSDQAAYGAAKHDYERAKKALEQMQGDVVPSAERRRAELAKEVRQIEDEYRDAETEARLENRDALGELRQQCRKLSVVIYPSTKAPEKSPDPQPAFKPQGVNITGVFWVETDTVSRLRAPAIAEIRPSFVGERGKPLPPWYTDRFLTGCEIVEQSPTGSTQPTILDDLRVQNRAEVLDGATAVAIRFVFLIKSGTTFNQTTRRVAVTGWHKIDPVERNRLYTIRLELIPEAMELLKTLLATAPKEK